MTKRDADELLRKDLRKFVAMFRKFGVDSILLGTLAYNVIGEAVRQQNNPQKHLNQEAGSW